MSATAALSVIIPASNEAGYIGACLQAVLGSEPAQEGPREVLVIANGCRDDTAARASTFADAASAAGWQLRVITLEQGSKPAALNTGDTAASGAVRVYLDADVVLSRPLLAQIARALATDAPRYATGTARIAPPRSAVTRAYARFWQRLPFIHSGAPGFGLYAVNAAGRARWGAFPDIISDDTFVRLSFSPAERVQLPATYDWPMAEGLLALIRVRRRQDQGVAELALRYPDLMGNEAKPAPDYAALMRADPLGFAVYGFVALVVRLTRGRNAGRFMRGRQQTG
ncbi:MAG: glycosyltransferase [Rhodobacteraceae bacterium]|nr:glycosyltransferase [Paracoccaceae bacterium]